VTATVGVDLGGTFTDVVVLAGGRMVTAKLPSTPGDPSRAVIEGVRRALAEAAVAPAGVSHFGHGTTVATNALIERRGARTGFVVTRGFGDLLALGRQVRPHLYRPELAPPPPLAAVTAEVDERLGPDRVLAPLNAGSITAAARRLRRAGVAAVAVCLLHSYRDPRHEREVARRLRDELPDVHLVSSVELAPEFREYERASTTVVDAYLGPPVAGYLRRLAASTVDEGLPEPWVMQSSGGLCTAGDASRHGSRLLLSGPAGGAAAVAALGEPDAVSFDMGGTSTDVCLVTGGSVGQTAERAVAGYPVRLPQVDVHTVGAGGGSIAWIDAGGALRVGPQSAGADPGPACYGRSGELPTVTDAHVALGRIDHRRPLAGDLRLDPRAARQAVARVADGFPSVTAAARGILAVANQEMVAAIRVVTVERGRDPAGLTLVAFGGAGPLHACDVAESLGIERVRVPAAGGVLSALGIAACDRRLDAVAAVMRPLSGMSREELGGSVPDPGRLERGKIEAACDLRYRGQAFELTIPLRPLNTLAGRFHQAHEQRFGFADRDGEIEVVAVRAAAIAPGAGLPATARGGRPGRARRGPEAVPMEGATLWIADGWSGRPDGAGGWLMRRG
jgi:N-methylhydantoinase A/oxoprolinase/acetone carboxylase beta subunit